MTIDIDERLTEIDIFKLVRDCGIPFDDTISDKDIESCLKQGIFLTTNAIYNSSIDMFSHKDDRAFDLLKIATIVNEINNNTYNYNYPIVVWEDWDDEEDEKDEENKKEIYDKPGTYDLDGNGWYHVRAFHYCKKNIYMSVNHSG